MRCPLASAAALATVGSCRDSGALRVASSCDGRGLSWESMLGGRRSGSGPHPPLRCTERGKVQDQLPLLLVQDEYSWLDRFMFLSHGNGLDERVQAMTCFFTTVREQALCMHAVELCALVLAITCLTRSGCWQSSAYTTRHDMSSSSRA